MPPPLHKLVLLGDDDASKRGLIANFCFPQRAADDPTRDPLPQRRLAVLDDESCLVECHDAAGGLAALRDQLLRDADGFLLVYSVTSRSSFERIERYHGMILRARDCERLPPTVLVGDNVERVADREVSRLEGFEAARRLGADFVEASHREQVNVERAFYTVVRLIREARGDGARGRRAHDEPRRHRLSLGSPVKALISAVEFCQDLANSAFVDI